MKKSILLSYLSLLLTFAMAFFICAQDEKSSPSQNQEPEESAAVMAPLPTAPPDAAATPRESPTERMESPASETEETGGEEKAPEMLRVKCGDEVYETTMQKYLVGVVAAEMPASFAQEALKAQAVAARSYALYCADSGKHAGTDADVCTDSTCCQAWISEETMRQNWQENFEEDFARISSAVEETDGLYLSYDGAPIFAAFHSSSGGYTEDCGAIWNSVPYLVSVESPETAESVPNFVSVLELRPLDFRDTILHADSSADFSGDESGWIQEIVRDGSGRVDYAVLGGVKLRGTELRSLFSLRSTNFELEYTEEGFRFTVTGFGHGVGMSQYGASVMAAGGADFREILAHYYPGTRLAGA